MKNLKAKLLTSVVMVLIAAVMMSTASFAWFTLSTNPEVKGATATMVTNDNFEIQDEDGVYGNLHTTDATGVVRPATFADGGWTATTFNEKGQPQDDGGVTITAADDGTLVGDDELIYGYWFDVTVRTNLEDASIGLCEATKRSSDGVEGEGSTVTCADNEFLQNNLCVAFALDGGTIVTATNTEGVLSMDQKTELTMTKDMEHTLTIYVYLGNGATAENSDASYGSTTFTGAINLQFTNGATTSMDVESAS